MLSREVSPVPQLQTAVPERKSDGAEARPNFTPWWKALFWVRSGPLGFRLALGLTSIVIMLVAVALVVRSITLRNETRQLAERIALDQKRHQLEQQLALQQSRLDELSGQLATAQQQHLEDEKVIERLKQSQIDINSRPLVTAATFLLLPGLSRSSGGGNEVLLTPGVSKIRLELALESTDYQTYRAVVSNSQRVEVVNQTVRPSHSRKSVTLQMSSSLFTAGDYRLQLNGLTASGATEPVNNYAFRVILKKN
jgi:hypothetical protein